MAQRRAEARVLTWVQWTTFTKLCTLGVTSGEPHPGGHAGVRVGEAQIPGPSELERDHAEE